MEISLPKRDAVLRITKLAALTLVGAELTRTIIKAKEVATVRFDKETGAFIISLLRDDAIEIAEIAGLVRKNDEIEADFDQIGEASLEKVESMLQEDTIERLKET